MKKNIFFILAAAIVLASACVSENMDIAQPEIGKVKLVLSATHASDPATKVEFSGTKVLWSPGDSISVFPPSLAGYRQGSKFVTSVTSPSLKADFSGILEGVGDWTPNGEDTYLALSPYSQNNYYYYGDILFPIWHQHAVDGGVDPTYFYSIAQSKTTDLHFKNITGGVILNFSEGCQDYSGVYFQNRDPHYMAGYYIVHLNDVGFTEVYEYNGSYDYIYLYAPEGGFRPGVDYYISLPPRTLTEGYNIIFENNNNEYAVKVFTKPQTVNCSVFGRLGTIDTGLVWTDTYTEEVADYSALSKQWTFTANGIDYYLDINTSVPGYYILCKTTKTDFRVSDFIKIEEVDYDITGDYYFISSDDRIRYIREVSDYSAKATFTEIGGVQVMTPNPTPVDLGSLLTAYVVEADDARYIMSCASDVIMEQFLAIAEDNDGVLPVVYTGGLGTAEDFSNTDVNGKVAIVNRGGNTFADKALNAYNAGAIGLLVVNNQEGIITMNLGDSEGLLPAAALPLAIKDHLVGKTSLPLAHATSADLP